MPVVGDPVPVNFPLFSSLIRVSNSKNLPTVKRKIHSTVLGLFQYRTSCNLGMFTKGHVDCSQDPLTLVHYSTYKCNWGEELEGTDSNLGAGLRMKPPFRCPLVQLVHIRLGKVKFSSAGSQNRLTLR